MSSGEGLIWAIRDQIVGRREDGEEKIIEPGIEDKRLMVYEGELSQALQAIGRDGNTLSAVIRLAWDGAPLRALTKNSKAACLEPHISIIGHFGGSVDQRALAELARKIKQAGDFSREVRAVTFGPDARSEWKSVYTVLSDGRPGLLGAVTARAEAQTLRLGMLYALLDRSASIQLKHLQAALAAWNYCQDSARFIFGDKLGDSTADAILLLLRGSTQGVTRSEIMTHPVDVRV